MGTSTLNGTQVYDEWRRRAIEAHRARRPLYGRNPMITGDQAAAIAAIREATAAAQFDWTPVVQASYKLTLYAVEQDLELQRERARGYWPVQCGDPLRGADRPSAYIDDALSVLRNGMRLDEDERDEPARRQLIESAAAVVAYIEQREELIERERARVAGAARPGAPRVDGFPMIARREPSGRRDYVGDRPVHAGDQLYLLTWRGWLPVRYESAGGRAAVICFSLPGVDEEVSIPGVAGALYAWPDQFA